MGRASTFTSSDLEFYEGLIHKTASMYAIYVEEDFDDIVQVLRIKVWRALGVYDPARSRLPRERYVFACVRNQVKDLVKRRKRNELFIEDVAPTQLANGDSPRDAFELRYLSSDEGQDFAHIESGPPLIPSTLTGKEREALALMYLDFSQKEAALLMGVRRNEMERTVKNVRDKMADWRPTPAFTEGASCPLPVAA